MTENKTVNRADKNLPIWDLSDLYAGADSSALRRDLKSVTDRSLAFQAGYQGNVAGLDGTAFYNAVAEYERLLTLTTRLVIYAELNRDTHLDDDTLVSQCQNIIEQAESAEGELLFFGGEIKAMTDDELAAKMDYAGNERYAAWLRSQRAFKDHSLPSDLKKLQYDKSVLVTSWIRMYNELFSSLTFNYGNKKLNYEEMVDLSAKAHNPVVKKQLMLETERVLKSNALTFALILNTLLKNKQINDQWEGFAHPYSIRNLSNQIDDDTVAALNDAVTASYKSISHRFYKMRKQWLGMPVLNSWDIAAELPFAKSPKYSWDEAAKIVVAAYNNFSPLFGRISKQFFDNGWIDAGIRKNKIGGGFMEGSAADCHGYILLNYGGKLEDVLALAHEVGHGIHQQLARHNGTLQLDPPLPLAEVASTFGEMLTFEYILKKETNPFTRFALLEGKTAEMINAAHRQISFHNFEMQIHQYRREQGELTPAILGKLWNENKKACYGPAVKIGASQGCGWIPVMHFFEAPFYVYSYTFADCVVNTLYESYKDGSVANFQDRYTELLSAGGTKSCNEALAIFGVDISQKTFWDKGLSVTKGFVDELERLTKTLHLERYQKLANTKLGLDNSNGK